jgi:hypothetical protein
MKVIAVIRQCLQLAEATTVTAIMVQIMARDCAGRG